MRKLSDLAQLILVVADEIRIEGRQPFLQDPDGILYKIIGTSSLEIADDIDTGLRTIITPDYIVERYKRSRNGKSRNPEQD